MKTKILYEYKGDNNLKIIVAHTDNDMRISTLDAVATRYAKRLMKEFNLLRCTLNEVVSNNIVFTGSNWKTEPNTLYRREYHYNVLRGNL